MNGHLIQTACSNETLTFFGTGRSATSDDAELREPDSKQQRDPRSRVIKGALRPSLTSMLFGQGLGTLAQILACQSTTIGSLTGHLRAHHVASNLANCNISNVTRPFRSLSRPDDLERL